MSRVFLTVLDAVGAGEAADAAEFAEGVQTGVHFKDDIAAAAAVAAVGPACGHVKFAAEAHVAVAAFAGFDEDLGTVYKHGAPLFGDDGMPASADVYEDGRPMTAPAADQIGLPARQSLKFSGENNDPPA